MLQITIRFDVEIELGENAVREEKRYVAYCRRLSGCSVRVRSEAENLKKIAQVIDMWLDLAQRHFSDKPGPLRLILDLYG